MLGPQDGLVDGASLRIDINGQVELLDPACVGAGASLLIDGAPAAQGAVPAGGDIQFTGVAVPRGAHALAIRVGPVGDQTVDSPPQQVIVDLATPNVRITQPTGAPPVQVLTDDRPDLDGQQTTVVAEVTEAAVDSARTAVLRLDGAPLGPPRAVPAGSPAMVSFVDVTLAAGPQTLEVCVTDGAGQSACASLAVDADAAAPDAVGDLTAEVIDPRRTEVALHFIAPGDDGAVGRVTAYALRRADAAIAAEADWNAAVATALALPATAAAGEAETLVLAGPGPGPLLADGLALDRLHFVAVRALDDAGRLGPIASVSVDLRLRRAEQLIPPRAGLWGAAALANTTSPVIGVGDVDGDGFDDVLVSAAQVDGVSQAALVFGAADPAAGEVRPLSIAAGMTDAFFGAVAAAAGDLNADGALDFAVQGYLDGFAGVAIALYFGCPDPDACDRAALAVPDALIVSRDGRFTNMLAGLGDFSRPAADGGAAIDDLFVGGSLGADQTAFVVAGRRIWPAPPAGVLIGNGAVDVGVTVLEVPEGPAGVYAAGVGDLDGDGFTDLALSAGADINASYVFYGGAGLAARLTYAAGNDRTVRLVDPCPGQGASFGTFFAGGVDLDGDAGGRPDFVVSNRINKRLAVFDQDLNSTDCFGRSPGQFGRVFDLAGDIDGDGALDLVVTHGDPTVNDAFVFYNDGAAVFGVGAVLSPRTAHVRLSLPASPKLGVAGAGDVNGDGRADLAAIYKRAGDGAVTVVVYY
ncbi:MAG: VCBS repeat-containing protein [Myxococcales bacterium]|nr:VCBS repeat-containing protein [Myxococcales bacterium]